MSGLVMPDRQLSDDFPVLQLVRTGRWTRRFAWLTFMALIATAIAMMFVRWRQTASGSGTVVALDPQQRPQTVFSPAEGIVARTKAGLREGSKVKQGEILVWLEPFAADGVNQLNTQVDQVAEKLERAKESLELAERLAEQQALAGKFEVSSLEKDVEAAKQKWKQAENEVLAVQASVKEKKAKLQASQRLAPAGVIPRLELVTDEQAFEGAVSKMLKAENAVEEAFATLNSKEKAFESKREQILIKNRQAEQKVLESRQKINTIQKELLDLEVKQAANDRLKVPAPRTGTIQQLFGIEGSKNVKKGEQLFVIVPEADELAVEMTVSGMDWPLIQEGDLVRLQFDGWPAVQFAGWPSAAIGTFGGKVNRKLPTDDGTGRFRVVVVPDSHFPRENGWPDDRYLSQGVRANGWVLLNRVTLGYEIWRQLNGFPPTVAPDSAKGGSDKGDKAKKIKPPKL